MISLRRQHRTGSDERLGAGSVFLVGHPRSGTSVLARALGCHPVIGYWEEPNLLRHAERMLAQLRALADHLQVDAIADLVDTPKNGRLRDVFGTEGVDPEASREIAVEAVRGMLISLRRAHLDRSGGSILLEKTPRQLLQMGVRKQVWPESTVIHMVRDPRDVAASAIEWEQSWGRPAWLTVEGPLVQACAQQWQDLVSMAPDDCLTVTYEEFAADPRGTTKGVLAQLGLDMHPDVEEFLRRGMGGAHDRSVGRWRRDLSDTDVRIVEHTAAGLMQRFDYR